MREDFAILFYTPRARGGVRNLLLGGDVYRKGTF